MRLSGLSAAVMAACLALLGCGGTSGVAQGRVVAVIDGDTIVVAGVGHVRYLGIDTPELHHPRKPVERFARRARAANVRLVAGRTVRLVMDRERRDRYGRLLAYVYVGPRMVNAEMVRLGFARTLTIRPNTLHAKLLARLESEARAARRGEWGDAEGGPPEGVP
jgi:micrococcal nuclease